MDRLVGNATHIELKGESMCLVKLDLFRHLPERQRQEVFLAALFHDIGKPAVTNWEDGNESYTQYQSPDPEPVL